MKKFGIALINVIRLILLFVIAGTGTVVAFMLALALLLTFVGFLAGVVSGIAAFIIGVILAIGAIIVLAITVILIVIGVPLLTTIAIIVVFFIVLVVLNGLLDLLGLSVSFTDWNIKVTDKWFKKNTSESTT